MRLLCCLILLCLMPAAVAGDVDVPVRARGLAVEPMIAPPQAASSSADGTSSVEDPVGSATPEVDVIDEALWARFARRNGTEWWLHEKTIVDKQGHSQLDNAKYIVQRFRDAGLPDSLALAAVVNSLMESSLLSHRIQPRSKATGLFQCWRNPRVHANLPRGGAGNGTPGFDWGNGPGKDATTEQMLDRDLNTDRILFELLRVENTTGKEFFGVPPGESFGGPILRRAREGASVAELAAMWGQRIERYRPGPGGSYSFRGRVAERLFGPIATVDTSHWRMNTLPPALDCPPPTLADGLHLENRPPSPVDATPRPYTTWAAPLGGGTWKPEGCP